MLVVELHERAVYLDVLSAPGYQAVEQKVDAARNKAGMVLILLDAADKS